MNQSLSTREEMEKLKVQVLGEVYKLVASKDYEAAISVVKQLKQMYPEDLELVDLTLKLRLAGLK